MIIKMIQELRKRMDAQSEKAQDVFNKELENIKGNQVELKNTIILVKNMLLLPLLLLSHSSRVRLCATPQTAVHQASPSLGFSRQEHWSGLPFPSPMHESDK